MNLNTSFQNILDDIFLKYRLNKIAIIQRIELPAIITKDGIAINLSTVDYIGHYKGYPVAFDAKECKNKNLNFKSYLKAHQIEFLKYWKRSAILQNKVLSGFLIYFYNLDLDNVYFYDIDNLLEDLNNNKKSVFINELKIKLPLNELLLEKYFFMNKDVVKLLKDKVVLATFYESNVPLCGLLRIIENSNNEIIACRFDPVIIKSKKEDNSIKTSFLNNSTVEYPIYVDFNQIRSIADISVMSNPVEYIYGGISESA